LLERLVARGLRGQLRTGNLLTGQLYVALDFFPNAAPAKLDMTADVPEVPTVPNSLDELQTQIASIARKLDKVPFEEIGKNLRDTLKSVDVLMKQLDGQVVPEMTGALPMRARLSARRTSCCKGFAGAVGPARSLAAVDANLAVAERAVGLS
jgi:paraquat-inducible protein B